MKVILLLPVIALLCVIASCRKTSNEYQAANYFYGKWNIVLDSFGAGAGSTAHVVAYRGQEGDYYNFDTDGHLYVKEGTNEYKYAYQFSSNSSELTLTYDGGSATNFAVVSFTNFSSQQMNLLSSWTITPGGIIRQSVYLKR